MTGDEIVDAVKAKMVPELGLDDVSDYVVQSLVKLVFDVIQDDIDRIDNEREQACICRYINDEHLSGWERRGCPIHGAHA